MRWRGLSARERRTITIGAVITIVSLALLYVVRPYRTALSDARDQLAAERETLARERAAIGEARRNPEMRRLADSAMRNARPRLFEGTDDVMASAELAAYLGDVARRTRVFLQDAATRPAAPLPGGVRTLRVEIRAESDLLGTLLFLQALERGDKLVRVDRLDITKSARAGDTDMEVLSIAATVSGFAVPDSGSTAAASARPTVADLSAASGGRAPR